MKSPISFICNDSTIKTEINSSTVILDFLRHHEHLTGVKEGCREGDCGACTILVGEMMNGNISYMSVNSCLMPIAAAIGKHVVTIEGLNKKELSPLQNIIIEEGATQCGFCTPGFIISLTGYLLSAAEYNYEDAVRYLGGNICRCTGYVSIKRAVEKMLDLLTNKAADTDRIHYLISAGILPAYFLDIKFRLEELHKDMYKISKDSLTGFLIAGGTDLYVQKEAEVLRSENIFLDIQPYINAEDNRIIVSASASVSDISNSEIIRNYLPHIREYLDLFGSEPIRNKATLGGNICNASPSADLTSIFLALDSWVALQKDGIRREVPLRKFFVSYKIKDMQPGEVIKELYFKIPPETALFNFEKVSKRTNLDIASVNTSMYIDVKDNYISKIHISAGGVSPIPLSLNKTAEYLTGKRLEKINILKAAELIQQEISPITDVRGSADYKRLLLHRLFLAHFIKLFPELFSGEELL